MARVASEIGAPLRTTLAKLMLSARVGVIPLPIALRLFALLFAPRGGRSLRARFRRMLRTEGLGGIARRLRRHEG